MKIFCLADTHLTTRRPRSRIDVKPIHEVLLNKLETVYKHAGKEGGDVLIAGDIFDGPRSWAALSYFIKLFKKYEDAVSTYVVYGQHDTHFYSEKTRGNTALGILIATGLVRLLNEKSTGIFGELADKTINYYGASFGAAIPKIEDSEAFNVLVIHAGISDRAAYPGHDFTDAEQFLKKHDFDLIICGDIHSRFIGQVRGKTIVNPGPLWRKTSDLYNFEPGYYVFDTKPRPNEDDWEFYNIPIEKAEAVIDRAVAEKVAETKALLNSFVDSFEEMTTERSGGKISFDENLVNLFKKNKTAKAVVEILAEVMDDEEIDSGRN